MRYARLLATLLIIAAIAPMVAAQCEVSDSFEFSYTNTNDLTDRVTFVLLNKTSADMSVTFDPGVLIVIPDDNKTFSVVASASEPLPGIQSAGFAIRDGTEIVAYATALFDLSSCPGAEPETPEQDSEKRFVLMVLLYTFVLLIIAVLIVWGVVALFDRREGPREHGERRVSEHEPSRERRAPINVDAMIRAERERSDHTPWWLWVLIVLVAVLVIGAFVYLLFSGTDVTGFNYGAGVNLTGGNATNLTNASA